MAGSSIIIIPMIDHSNNYGYSELAHPADVALKIWGDCLDNFFKAALDGLYHLSSIEFDKNAHTKKTLLYLPSEKIEILLVDFLNEMIFMIEEGKAFVIHCMTSTDDGTRFVGEEKSISKIDRFVKAATFSELEVHKNGDHFEALVVFDV